MNKKNKELLSSAIPEMPQGFDRAVETALSDLRKAEAKKRRIRRPMVLVAAALGILLCAGTVFGLYKLLAPDFKAERYLKKPQENRETIQDVEKVLSSAKPADESYTITLMPDLPEAEAYAEWREKTGQPPFSLEDWGWLLDIEPQISEVLYTGDSLIWNTLLKTDDKASFMVSWGGGPAAHNVDALVDWDVRYTMEGDSQSYEIFVSGTGTNPRAEDLTLYAEAYRDAGTAWHFEGTVTVTQTIRIIDCNVDVMSPIATLALITHSFTFEAEDAAVKAPVDIEVPLSGEYLLTVYRADEISYTRTNELLDLSGVTLNAHVEYRSTGIYVTLTIKDCPAWWDAWYTQALLSPAWDDTDMGLFAKLLVNGEAVSVQYPNAIGTGELPLILPLFPSEYASLNSVTLALTLNYLHTRNGQAVETGVAVVLEEGSGGSGGCEPQSIATLKIPIS